VRQRAQVRHERRQSEIAREVERLRLALGIDAGRHDVLLTNVVQVSIHIRHGRLRLAAHAAGHAFRRSQVQQGGGVLVEHLSPLAVEDLSAAAHSDLVASGGIVRRDPHLSPARADQLTLHHQVRIVNAEHSTQHKEVKLVT
jgi:hypothetical protein